MSVSSNSIESTITAQDNVGQTETSIVSERGSKSAGVLCLNVNSSETKLLYDEFFDRVSELVKLVEETTLNQELKEWDLVDNLVKKKGTGSVSRLAVSTKPTQDEYESEGSKDLDTPEHSHDDSNLSEDESAKIKTTTRGLPSKKEQTKNGKICHYTDEEGKAWEATPCVLRIEQVSMAGAYSFFEVLEQVVDVDSIGVAFLYFLILLKTSGSFRDWLQQTVQMKLTSDWRTYEVMKLDILAGYRDARKRYHKYVEPIYIQRFFRLHQKGLVDKLTRRFDKLIPYLPPRYHDELVLLERFRTALKPHLFHISLYQLFETWRDVSRWAKAKEYQLKNTN